MRHQSQGCLWSGDLLPGSIYLRLHPLEVGVLLCRSWEVSAFVSSCQVSAFMSS